MKKILSTALILISLIICAVTGLTASADTDAEFEAILKGRLITGIEYKEAGDVNLDSVSDIKDLVRIKKLSSKLITDGDGDLNADGKIDSTDMAFLKRFLLNYDAETVYNFDNEIADNWNF